jgi:hypothetical protein
MGHMVVDPTHSDTIPKPVPARTRRALISLSSHLARGRLQDAQQAFKIARRIAYNRPHDRPELGEPLEVQNCSLTTSIISGHHPRCKHCIRDTINPR